MVTKVNMAEPQEDPLQLDVQPQPEVQPQPDVQPQSEVQPDVQPQPTLVYLVAICASRPLANFFPCGGNLWSKSLIRNFSDLCPKYFRNFSIFAHYSTQFHV